MFLIILNYFEKSICYDRLFLLLVFMIVVRFWLIRRVPYIWLWMYLGLAPAMIFQSYHLDVLVCLEGCFSQIHSFVWWKNLHVLFFDSGCVENWVGWIQSLVGSCWRVCIVRLHACIWSFDLGGLFGPMNEFVCGCGR